MKNFFDIYEVMEFVFKVWAVIGLINLVELAVENTVGFYEGALFIVATLVLAYTSTLMKENEVKMYVIES